MDTNNQNKITEQQAIAALVSKLNRIDPTDPVTEAEIAEDVVEFAGGTLFLSSTSYRVRRSIRTGKIFVVEFDY